MKSEHYDTLKRNYKNNKNYKKQNNTSKAPEKRQP